MKEADASGNSPPARLCRQQPLSYILTVQRRRPAKKWWRGYPLYAPIALLPIWMALARTDSGKRLDFFLLDRLIQLRHSTAQRADSRLFFVGIDDATQTRFGRWPFARVFHGEFLGFLSAAHPAAVAWDILFAEEDAINDDALVQGIEMLGAPVITAAARANAEGGTPAGGTDFGLTLPLPRVEGGNAMLGTERVLVPVPALRKVSRFGFADSLPALDGVRRKVPLVFKIGSDFYPSFALQAAMQFWQLRPEQVRVVLGDAVYIESPQAQRRIPIDASGEYWINYRHEDDAFWSGSYGKLHRALSRKYNGDASANVPDLAGKLVVIALTSTGSSEIAPSPLNERSLVPLVHMNVLDNILREDYLRLANGWLIWICWLIIAYASVGIFERLDFSVAAAALGGLVVAALGAMSFLFVRANFWLPLGMPILGFVTLHLGGTGRRVLEEQRAKQQIKKAFSSYLAPAVLDEVMKNPDELKLGGVRKQVTILFSDIRGFTSWTESGAEEDLVAQLNEYFTEMVACVNRHGGTLHKFIGDAIMAVWGDAISLGSENDARRALLAALEMRAALARLNQKWEAENRPPLRIGIGLEHGDVLVGNMGAPQRMEFTVIGDAVNVASRIEGLTKEWQVDIAVGEKVRTLAGDRFFYRALGRFRLFGKRAAVCVSALVRELQPAEGAPPVGAIYEKAVADYLAGDFKNALAGFERCLRAEPGEYCAQRYAEICRDHLTTPPVEPWDGVHVSKTK